MSDAFAEEGEKSSHYRIGLFLLCLRGDEQTARSDDSTIELWMAPEEGAFKTKS